jgi:hypothetical protein
LGAERLNSAGAVFMRSAAVKGYMWSLSFFNNASAFLRSSICFFIRLGIKMYQKIGIMGNKIIEIIFFHVFPLKKELTAKSTNNNIIK